MSNERATPCPYSCAKGKDDILPDAVPELEQLSTAHAKEREECLAYIKRVSALENPEQGVSYAAQLHEAKQYKLMLDFKIEACRVKINRLNLGMVC